MGRGLTRCVILGMSLAVWCGCDDAPSTAGGCAKAVVWQGSTYVAIEAGLPRGDRVGTAVLPDCESDNVLGRPVVYEVRGVSTTVALGVEDNPGEVFLAQGFLPELAGHPAHDAIYGSPSEPRARSCSGRWRSQGTVTSNPFSGMLLVEVAGEEVTVFLHARTRVRVAVRGGEPYLDRGDRVTLAGRWCTDRGTGRQRFADRVVAG
jgi:hypothetical protein